MRTKVKDKLFSFIEQLKSKVKESDFDPETYEWKLCNRQRFKEIAKSWRNICNKYRRYFDSREDYILDLNLFDFELRTMETEYILKHLYGAVAEHDDVFNLVVDTREPASEVAIKIINSLNYQIL